MLQEYVNHTFWDNFTKNLVIHDNFYFKLP